MIMKIQNKNILVLGDCTSNGNNCLGHLVYEDSETVLTYSLQYHKKFKEIVRWFLRERKKGNFLDKKVTIKNLNYVALKTLKEEEKKISWPNLLDFNITNKSTNGNHFCNYIIQLTKYCENNENPDLVLITDHPLDHMVVYFTRDKKKYRFLCEPQGVNEKYDSHKHHYPYLIHQEKINFIKKQNSYSSNYQRNKSRRYLSILEKKLQQKNISYFFVLFRKKNEHLFSPEKIIDLTDIKETWCSGNKDEYESREISSFKYDLQSKCATIVQKKLDEHFNNLDKNSNLM